MTLLVQEDDAPRVAELLAADWTAALSREGLAPVVAREPTGPGPSCPACGFAGPLIGGACGDCGLALG